MTDHLSKRWIPAGYEEVARDDNTGAVVYAGGKNGKLFAIGYSGKRSKPDFHFRYSSPEKVAEAALKHLGNCRDRAELQNDRRERRKAQGRGVEVGDILHDSWGYDQTNVDYYEVTALIGSTMVEIRKIGAESYDTGSMCGQCVPMKGKYIGEPMRKIAKDGAVKVRKWGSWAHKMTPKMNAAGVPVYSSSYWSSYA